MSHYTVIVCLPPMPPDRVMDALEARLAPFDEGLDVEPYRVYIENWQDEYGQALKFFTDHPEHKPAGLDELDAAAVMSAYMETEVREETKEGSDVVLFDRMSTYNPKSKWDWWVIGGRWLGYFPFKPEHDGDPRLITGRPGSFDNKAEPRRVDGGPRGLLDFEALRKVKSEQAAARYARWAELVDGLPKARPWSHFLGLHDADPEGYGMERARKEYREQPRVRKADEAEEFQRWFGCVIEEFAVDREAYVQRAAESAVPAFALLDLEGRWLAPGEMGCFGVSSDNEDTRVAYYARANAYLDGLPEDAWVVVVDCHI